MISVLVAEDEPPIARAISRMIEELSPVFKVVACESNGQSALEYMRRDPVDLVFTDIRMPMMDGLELLRALRADWPDCLTVIVSGHQDFEYTQSAIRLGAFDYLLKPISREKLREMLDRLEDVHARSLLREAVGSWRTGGIALKSGLALSKDVTYALILAIAGHWPNIADDALSPGAVFWQANDPELIIKEILGDEPGGVRASVNARGCITFVGRAAAERVFLLENTTPAETSAIAERLFGKLNQLSPLPKTLCVIPGRMNYEDIASSIRSARKQVYTKIALCCSALLKEPGSDAGNITGSVTGSMTERVTGSVTGRLTRNWYKNGVTGDSGVGAIGVTLSTQTLAEALCVRNEKQVGAAVEEAVDTAVRAGMTQMVFENFLEAVIHDKRLSFDTKALKEELNEAILDAVSPEGLTADISQIFCLYVLGESKAELKTRVDHIQQYLSAHYSEEISSETLSARFGFVPSYLSKVFRRQTGMSPTEYLTKMRMEKAKELLETRPGILIRDAAALVGYKDPYYFSKLFRKTTGSWPSQYQEKL